jgi:hypothetical protein
MSFDCILRGKAETRVVYQGSNIHLKIIAKKDQHVTMNQRESGGKLVLLRGRQRLWSRRCFWLFGWFVTNISTDPTSMVVWVFLLIIIFWDRECLIRAAGGYNEGDIAAETQEDNCVFSRLNRYRMLELVLVEHSL